MSHKNIMQQYQQLQKKASTTVAQTEKSSDFLQTRPFATNIQIQNTFNKQPNLQAKVVNTSGFGHSFGNYNISPTTSVIQPKLTIGEPGDKYEQEADRVSAEVVQRINQPEPVSDNQEQTVQRMDLPDEDELMMKPLVQRMDLPDEDELMMKPLVQRQEAINGGDASAELESSINSARGGGQSLDANLQRSIGEAMGADFSRVRVHTDTRADALNKSIQAKAFTTGQDIFFRQGAYQPGSRGGQELIAHELTHVVQQSGG